MPRLFLLLACVGCLSALACSNTSTTEGGNADSGSGDAGCTAYVPDADLVTPTVSFQADILPTFQRSCGIGGATCHGDVAGQDAGLQRPFLGFFDGGTPPESVISAIVGVPSNEDPRMDEVTARDPAHSFLMHKLDGDQCTLAADCAEDAVYPTCGSTMPQTATTLLDQPTRDAIRRWIAQGARNN